MTDQWTDRLSEYLDGELPAAEAEAWEAHLISCAECRRTLQQLRLVVTRASQVIDHEPTRDLWAGIATRIAAPDIEVAAETSNKRRLSFSVPQLAAASVVLMLMSAGTMYLMVKSDEAAPVVATAQPSVNGTPAAVRTVTNNYDAAVDQLEAVLHDNRDQLDTATVRVIEQNLAIIDRAIMEARAALGQEPANPYLSKYLDEAMQRKVQLLRRATGVMRAQT